MFNNSTDNCFMPDTIGNVKIKIDRVLSYSP